MRRRLRTRTERQPQKTVGTDLPTAAQVQQVTEPAPEQAAATHLPSPPQLAATRRQAPPAARPRVAQQAPLRQARVLPAVPAVVPAVAQQARPVAADLTAANICHQWSVLETAATGTFNLTNAAAEAVHRQAPPAPAPAAAPYAAIWRLMAARNATAVYFRVRTALISNRPAQEVITEERWPAIRTAPSIFQVARDIAEMMSFMLLSNAIHQI